MPDQFEFSRARASKKRAALAFVAVADYMSPYYPFGRFIWYDATEPRAERWSEYQLDLCVHGITVYQRPEMKSNFCVISAEGDVVFMGARPDFERIPGTGLHSSDSKFWGRMENIEAIGDHLYACGGGGQVYKRSLDGVWQNLDPSLLQGPDTSVFESNIFYCIDGPNEQEIYVVGRFGKILFWNGQKFQVIEPGTDDGPNLINIHVESPSKIWVCGNHGTLLCGNHRDGFRQVPGANTDQLLQSVTQYEDDLYLGAGAGHPIGIMRYDGRRLERVYTELEPEVTDSHTVTASNGVLWSVGIKDIVCFDGKAWERIDFPGNTPIR